MAVSAFGYLGIGVSDMDRWREFATTGVLGLEETEVADDGTVYLRMDEYHHRFSLHPTGENDLVYIGLEVTGIQEFEEMAETLRKAGVTITAGTDEEKANRKVLDLFKFKDPSGIPLEIYHGGLQIWERPFKPARNISGFKTKTEDGIPMGMGHMVLFIKDMKATVSFWRDVLGFKISDYIDLNGALPGLGTATFFHCNPRHHSIAFVEMAVPRFLQHFMVELNDLNDVGLAYYMCQDDGVPMSQSIGRHTNDHMVSFYLVSPSGFDVEYGWGGRVIDDSKWVVQQHVSPGIWGHRPMQSAGAPPAAEASETVTAG